MPPSTPLRGVASPSGWLDGGAAHAPIFFTAKTIPHGQVQGLGGVWPPANRAVPGSATPFGGHLDRARGAAASRTPAAAKNRAGAHRRPRRQRTSSAGQGGVRARLGSTSPRPLRGRHPQRLVMAEASSLRLSAARDQIGRGSFTRGDKMFDLDFWLGYREKRHF